MEKFMKKIFKKFEGNFRKKNIVSSKMEVFAKFCSILKILNPKIFTLGLKICYFTKLKQNPHSINKNFKFQAFTLTPST